MTSKIPEYDAHAQEADRLARASQSPDERAAYERIATVWRELAAAEGAVRAEATAEG